MKLSVDWDGSETPFEGDRAILIRTIPEGARVISARVTVTPVDPGASSADPNDSFVERVVFSGAGPTWGANKVQGADFVEVDFRARRTLAGAQVSGLTGVHPPANLQIDPGGVYVEINDRGAIFTPTDTRLTIPGDSAGNALVALPSFQVARFKITRLGGPAPNISEVRIHSVPENVSLRPGSEPVFHTFLGQMTDPEDSIDFATLLTEFLGAARIENGFFNVPLIVHSDAIARLKIKVTLDVLQEQKPLKDVPESVLGFSVDAIPVGAATQFKFDLPVGSEAVAGRSAVRFQGAFADTRIAFGPLAPQLTGLEVDVTPAANRPQAQAQPFTISQNLNITGIDLLLTPKTDAAEVLVDIRDDLGGKPGLTSLLAAPLKVTVGKTPKAEPQWLTTALPSELHLSKDQPRWLIVQRSLGEVTWSVQPAAAGPGLQQTTDEALSWRTTAAGATTKLEAFFRLRHRPPQFTMPIHVFVGEGAEREEVPLEQFEPLGRVDFVLDTEEFAATINQVAAKTVASECQSVEHLRNGDLEEWLRSGSAPGPGRTSSQNSQAVVLAPAGNVVYTVEWDGAALALKVVDPLCGRPIGPPLTLSNITTAGNGIASVAAMEITSVAVNPSGQRLYVALGNRIWLADAASMTEIGSIELLAPIRALAAGGGSIFMILSNGAPQLVAIEEDELARAIGKSLPTESILAPVNSVAIAATADGRTVCVATADTSAGGGGLALLVKPPASQASISLPSFTPAGVTLSPDGKQAFVTTTTAAGPIYAVDLATGAVTAGPTVSVVPSVGTASHVSLAAITADRLAVLGSDSFDQTKLEVIDFGKPVPKWWDLTTGAIEPISFPVSAEEPLNIGGWLGKRSAESSPLSSISQVVPVTGGCLYEFSFYGSATALGAAADLIWRGDTCTASRTDSIPITPKDGLTFCADPLPLEFHRLRVRVPEGATQAEVRFRATEGVNAVIDRVSLKPPPGPVSNSDFEQATPAGVPEGWSLEPPNALGFMFQNGEIKNLGIDSLALVQEVSVTPGRPFRLEFQGEVEAPGDPPVAAVHWNGADPVELELAADGIGLRVAAGTIPEGVTTAEVSLTLPGHTTVKPDYFLLRTGVTTGLTFSVFAEAPGELTVSQFQIVSDAKPEAPPTVPPGGLCPPTKPGNDPDDPEECNFCPCCEEDTEMETATKTAVISGRTAAVTVATCKDCGATVVRSTGAPASAPKATAVRFNVPTFAVPRRPTPAQLSQAARRQNAILRTERSASLVGGPRLAQAAPRTSALYAIRTISHEEVKSLEAAGITTLDQLTALKPKDLAALLPGSTVNRVRLLLGRARKARGPKPQ